VDVGSPLFFYLFAGIAMTASLMVVVNKNPVSSAMSLIVAFVALAAVYALLGAHLITAMQILVYTGAVTVLFVFVIMLLNADFPSLDLARTSRSVRAFTVFLLAGLIGIFAFIFRATEFGLIQGGFTPEIISAKGGNTKVVSELMFSEFILAFEVVGILLLASIVAVVIVAMRKNAESGGGR